MKVQRKIYTISLLGIIVLFCFLSCEDSIEYEVNDYQSKLVVDGWIENNKHPVVVLTKSAAYFSRIDSAVLRKLIASRAKVTVSDGETEEVLTLKKNELYFPPYIYQGTDMKGEAGKTYHLTIETGGKIYRSSTTIPPAVQFDSLWFNLAPGKDDLGLLYGRLTDAGDMENYYRIFTQRASRDDKFIPIYLSAIGDQYFNGESFTFSLLRGAEQISDAVDDIYFRKGDTVRVKLSAIDRSHFDFWRTLERELYVTVNPFSSTGNEVLSNISGGALGVWGGYNSTTYQIIARE